MAITSSTRKAKCKDCKFIKRTVKFHTGLVRHKCDNPESKLYNKVITLNDLVCDEWKL